MSDATGTNSHDSDHDSDPVADDINRRNADSGDIVAGEQVLDEGKVSPSQDDFGDENDDSDDSTEADDRKHAADERTDAGAAPIQPEAS